MNRQTKVFRSGSSLAVRIPKELAAALDLTEGVEITLHLRDSALVLHKEQNVMTTDYSEQPMFTVHRVDGQDGAVFQALLNEALREPIDSPVYSVFSKLSDPGSIASTQITTTEKTALRRWLTNKGGGSECVTIVSQLINRILEEAKNDSPTLDVARNTLYDLMAHWTSDWAQTLGVSMEEAERTIMEAANGTLDDFKNKLSDLVGKPVRVVG